MARKKTLDRLLENLPGRNEQYYIEHGEDRNSLRVRQDWNQKEKEDLFEFTLNTDKKLGVVCQSKN